MLEVKMLLKDVESYGAKVVLKDGQPRLIGKVPEEVKAQLKEYRSEIITLLSPVKEELFDVPAPEQGDVVSKKEKRKVKETPVEKRPVNIEFYCSYCYCLSKGRLYEKGTLQRDSSCVYLIDGEYFCNSCEYNSRSIASGIESQKLVDVHRKNGVVEKANQVVSRKDYFTGEAL